MRFWESKVYRNNHQRLTVIHTVLFIPWVMLLLSQFFSGFASGWVLLVPLWIHGLLAYGSHKKIEVSRKISEWVFWPWLVLFPIGTFLAIYLLLPATQWQEPEASGGS